MAVQPSGDPQALGYNDMKLKLDNRMEWIRNVERLKSKPTSTYTAEYELASESSIPGVLDYENGSILCGLMTFEKDPKGLSFI